MVEVDFPKRALTPPRELERRPVADEYRQGRVGGEARENAVARIGNGFPTNQEQGVAMNTVTSVNLRKLQEQLDRKPLDEIAMLLQALTYGEMIELAEAMWKALGEGSSITQEGLPSLLHRWSKSRAVVVSIEPPPV